MKTQRYGGQAGRWAGDRGKGARGVRGTRELVQTASGSAISNKERLCSTRVAMTQKTGARLRLPACYIPPATVVL